MAKGKKNTKAQIFNEINITPLTDIFLVLLIIMMVIAPLLDQQGLNLAVPQIGAPPDEKKDVKIISVDVSSTGIINIEGKTVNKESIIYTLTDLKKEKKDGLIIQVDPDSTHQTVVMVMDAARTAGIENISVMEKRIQPTK